MSFLCGGLLPALTSQCVDADALLADVHLSLLSTVMLVPRRLVLMFLLLGTLFGPLAAQPVSKPTRAVVVSDLNESYGSTRYSQAVDEAVRQTIALAPDLVISTGDMVAGQRLNPPLDKADIEAMWQAFDRHVTTPLAQAGLPFAVTPGNHDASNGARFALERELYRGQWLPRKPALDFVDAADYPFNYAFRVRDTLFVSLDATHVGHLSVQSKRWLSQLLAQHGPKYKHRVVFSHIPLWPFAVGRERDYLGDHELEAILQRGQGGVVLSGHHHAYYPGYKDGVRFVSQACLGAAPRPLLGTQQPSHRAITVLELGDDGQVRIEAYHGERFAQPILRATLPEKITAHGATLHRDDLALPAATVGRSPPVR
jgi:3',5'-cyclic AMP phosphodiesterase CpdA